MCFTSWHASRLKVLRGMALLKVRYWHFIASGWEPDKPVRSEPARGEPERSGWLWILGLCLVLAACSTRYERVWQEKEGYRVAPLAAPVGRTEGFTAVKARATGIDFANALARESWLGNRHLVNGSGVALGDVNGDDLPDIFLARLEGPNALYFNLGAWRFEEAAGKAGVAAPDAANTGVLMADLDGDLDLDLVLTSMGGGTAAFANNGTGLFDEVTQAAGLTQVGGATSMALADVDGDRDLDLYVGYYKTRTVKDLYPPAQLDFERVVWQQGDTFSIVPQFEEHYTLKRQHNRLMRLEIAEPDRFYQNDGAGVFSPIAFTGGAFAEADGRLLRAAPRDWTLSVRLQDLNGDGIPDLYVCNDFESPDHFWLGDGEGGFRAAAGVSVRKSSQSTMSVAAGDVNADGFTDLFLADMLSRQYQRRQRQYQVIPPEVAQAGDIDTRPQVMQNVLLMGRGDGTFAEVAHLAGVAASEWTWSSLFMDVDLDGYEDLLLTTGHAYDALDGDAQMRTGMPGADWRRHLLAFPDLNLHNLAFRNRGDGTFMLMPDGWGLGVLPDVSHGLAFADMDQDGDLDAVVNRLNASAGVFLNGATASRIAVRLKGTAPNTQGVGALIRVSGDGLPPRQKEVLAGGLYLSSSEALCTFAALDGAAIEVRWRSGLRSVIRNARTNHLYEVFESHASSDTSAKPAPAVPLMKALRLDHSHQESYYEDFARQPLLPRRLSQRGPAIALADIDADGDDEIIVGNGRGGRLTVLENHAGVFAGPQPLGPQASGDHAGLVVTPGGAILVGVSNYERTPDTASDPSLLLRADSRGAIHQTVMGQDTPGPLVLADFNGDQRLDVFVGGHFVPGLYPAAASSRVYQMEGSQLTYDAAMSKPFAGVGLVSGAAAADLDLDGDLDLALAMDWGPLRVFVNDGRGVFEDRTRALGLSSSTGWWNGVAFGDFDSDGRLDLVGTNWGRNTMYGQSAQPLLAYYGDLDRNGIMDVLEARYDPSLQDYGMVRDLRALSSAVPPLFGRLRSYRAFSETSTAALLGERLSTASKVEAATLLSAVFLNRGDFFESVPLPSEAQWAPAFAAVVADFDGDGAEDLFLSQNFFAVPPSTPRMDAGRGLLLRGDGHGGFVPSDDSGIRVYGEQRAATVGDLDRDGRTDLVVAQNAASLRLFMNQRGKPGLRVILRGPMVGAMMRLRYADGTSGPARVVSAGSGYWSQHSFEQILGKAAPVASVWVRWPGGAESVVPIAEDQSTVIIAYDDGT